MRATLAEGISICRSPGGRDLFTCVCTMAATTESPTTFCHRDTAGDSRAGQVTEGGQLDSTLLSFAARGRAGRRDMQTEGTKVGGVLSDCELAVLLCESDSNRTMVVRARSMNQSTASTTDRKQRGGRVGSAPRASTDSSAAHEYRRSPCRAPFPRIPARAHRASGGGLSNRPKPRRISAQCIKPYRTEEIRNRACFHPHD